MQTVQCRADVCAAPKSCVDGKGLKRRRAKYRTLKMKGRDVQKTKQNSNLKTKRKSKAATPCDCRASVSNPAAQPTVQTLNCLVVVLLLTTDSMTLENKEGGGAGNSSEQKRKNEVQRWVSCLQPLLTLPLRPVGSGAQKCLQHQLFAILLETQSRSLRTNGSSSSRIVTQLQEESKDMQVEVKLRLKTLFQLFSPDQSNIRSPKAEFCVFSC